MNAQTGFRIYARSNMNPVWNAGSIMTFNALTGPSDGDTILTSFVNSNTTGCIVYKYVPVSSLPNTTGPTGPTGTSYYKPIHVVYQNNAVLSTNANVLFTNVDNISVSLPNGVDGDTITLSKISYATTVTINLTFPPSSVLFTQEYMRLGYNSAVGWTVFETGT